MLCGLRLAVGSTFLGVPAWDSPVLGLRAFRLLEAVIVGAALAGAGVALQALLRNPLAEPFVLGLSTGAALGVIVQLCAKFWLRFTPLPQHAAAMLGALVCMALVYGAGRRRGVVDPLGLLLVGVVLSTINGAIIMLLSYLAAGEAGIRDDLSRWMLGYLNEGLDAWTVWTVGGATAGVLGLLVMRGRAMDVASFSADESQTLGLNVNLLRTQLFLSASVLAAGAVVVAGPVAFVGLVCPHVARLLLGPRHVTLLLGSAMLGAMLIVSADTASAWANLALGIGLVPVGVFTAMLGGPVFLWLLRSRLGRGE